MDIRFVGPGLSQLDQLQCEALVLPMFLDERPLSGLLGLVDWRLCGFLSHRVASGRIDGSQGEMTLLPGRPRLPIDKLILVGLGPSAEFDHARLEQALEQTMRALARAKVRSYALVLPGRNLGKIAAEEAMEAFVGRARGEDQDEITLIDSQPDRKIMAAVLERERRRARAPVD